MEVCCLKTYSKLIPNCGGVSLCAATATCPKERRNSFEGRAWLQLVYGGVCMECLGLTDH